MSNIDIIIIIIYALVDSLLLFLLYLNYFYLNWAIYPFTFSMVQYSLGCFKTTLYFTAGVYCIELLNPDICLTIGDFLVLYLLYGLIILIFILLISSGAVRFRVECYLVNYYNKKFKYLC